MLSLCALESLQMEQDSSLAAAVSCQEADLLLFKLLAARKPAGAHLHYKPQLLASQFLAEAAQLHSGQSETPARLMQEERVQTKANPAARVEERFMDFLKKKTFEEFGCAGPNPYAPKPPKEDPPKQLLGRPAAPSESRPFYAGATAGEAKPAEAKHEGFMTARHLLERNLRQKGHFTQQFEPQRQAAPAARDEGR